MERPKEILEGFDRLVKILGSTYGVSNEWSMGQSEVWSDYAVAYRHALEYSESGEMIPDVHERAVSRGVSEHWLKLAEIFAIRDYVGMQIAENDSILSFRPTFSADSEA